MSPHMDGIIIMDKPPEFTSARVVTLLKRILGIKKVGHTGTLDPFATGVLVCCLGRATRLARFFLHGDKTYEAVMVLGVETDTQDLTGKVLEKKPIPDLSDQDISMVFSGFRGEIEQFPPVYSALKHQGVPLYKLARQGKPVQKPPRKVTIHSLDILERKGDRIRFSTTCSGGTYIRALCTDIGRALGCGAHLEQLRRTANSGFTLDEAVMPGQLEALAARKEAHFPLVSMADALRRMPEVTAPPEVVKKITHGSTITRRDLGLKAAHDQPQDQDRHVKVVDGQRNLVAVLDSRPDGVGFSYCCVFT